MPGYISYIVNNNKYSTYYVYIDTCLDSRLIDYGAVSLLNKYSQYVTVSRMRRRGFPVYHSMSPGQSHLARPV